MSQSKLTVLRTIAGAAPCVSQIQEFQKLGVRLVCTDADPLSVGFGFADAAYTVPLATDPTYISRLLEVCRRENVQWIVPALEEELLPLAYSRDQFEAVGTRILLSDASTLEICIDKYRTYTAFSGYGVKTPPTVRTEEILDEDAIISYPQIVKPRRGRGSSGIFVVHNWQELQYAVSRTSCGIAQDFIKGVEYTIDVLADFDGNLLVISPRRRIATDSGISYKGGTEWRQDIVDGVRHLFANLRIAGPVNVQCMVDESGGIWFTEVNARLAGSCILTVAAGVPLLDGTVALMRGEVPEPHLRPAKELVMLRYWTEMYVEPHRRETMSQDIR